ncbi:recombinase family protein [Tsukamurella tyrosinosolvens]|uniref:recombinase family protein n=1 Tax=Tsukamurella tyrosinosolvens TaxID=57704 RepID=UPI00079773E9|nr:recombinase family protein [Tsukamurella tyrosinosolvens]KXP02206.1 hypothetical protein AXK59_16735 [Tsukamurella tyrosinosolvens]
MQALIYCRISRDRSGEHAGVQRQEADCRELAASLGWDVADVLVDNDVSATKSRPRPAFVRLIDLLSSGAYGGLLFWHPDRAYRRLEDLGSLIEVAKANNVAIRTVKAGEIDLTTASGILQAEILASVAKHETARMAERVKRAKAETLAQGGYRGGPRPFGYESDGMTIRESEAALVREAAAHVLDGGSLRRLTIDWNDRGHVTARGREWRVSTIRHILLTPRVAGLVPINGRSTDDAGKAQWPGIISEDDWRAVVAILRDPARTTTTSYEIAHQGVGGAYLCGVCGATVNTVKSEVGRSYKCSKSTHLSAKKSSVDEFVDELVIGRLSMPDAVEAFAGRGGGDAGALRAERDRLDSALAERVDMLDAGDLSVEQFRRSSGRLREQLAAVDRKLAAESERSPLADLLFADDVAEHWKSLTPAVRSQVIKALMVVRILRFERRGPMSGRIAIEWR